MLITAPEELDKPEYPVKTLFLAGTIDNGDSEDWQDEVGRLIKYDNLTILNPRRTEWNPNAKSFDVSKQIIWEQKYLQRSDYVFLNILPKSTSMISLLELGQMCERMRVKNRCAASGSVQQYVVCCPREYMRFDNVFTMCAINKIALFTDYDLAIQYLNIQLHLKF